MIFRDILYFTKRWWWLIALGVILGLSAGNIYCSFVPQVYQARSKVMIIDLTNHDARSPSQRDDLLAQTFTELIVTRPVLEAASNKLGYEIRASQIQIQQVRDAKVIAITVEDPSPQHAADIANTLVEVFLEEYGLLQSMLFRATEDSLHAQRSQLEEQISNLQNQLSEMNQKESNTVLQQITENITDLQAEIVTIQRELAALENPTQSIQSVNDRGDRIFITPTPTLEQRTEVLIKRARRDDMISLLRLYNNIYVDYSLTGSKTISSNAQEASQIRIALALYQKIHTNLLSNYETIRLTRLRSTPDLVQVEKALPPLTPVRPNVTRNTILGGVLGVFLFGAIAFLIEFTDETLRTPGDVSEVLQLPILGYIGSMRVKLRDKAGAITPYVLSRPRSPISEAFRSLRTNLEFTEVDKPLKTLLISSPDSSEGKTAIAVNLAFTMGQGGKKVLLLDADLRQPEVHKRLGISNRLGLSDVLRGREALDAVIQVIPGRNVSIIPSGKLPSNPVEVLNSQQMVKTLNDLKSQYDIVVLDAPPFTLADAGLLSSQADGVIMVVQPNSTKATQALAMLEQLERAGAQVLGVVLNRVTTQWNYASYKSVQEYAANSTLEGSS